MQRSMRVRQASALMRISNINITAVAGSTAMKMKMLTILAAGIAVALSALEPARAGAFTANDYITYGQSGWPSDPTAEANIANNFNTVYASGSLIVGIGNNMTFDSPGAIGAYLPSNGPAAPLGALTDDPTTTPSGVYGGDVTALALNVDFSAFGLLPGTSSIPFGNLLLMGFSGTLSGLDGMTVSTFLTLNETALGGGSIAPFVITDIDPVLQQVNASFALGEVTTFATDHLEFASSLIPATPVPAALPLFATGLGGLGLLGWRRKRKAAALSA